MVKTKIPSWALELRAAREKAGVTQREASAMFGKKLRIWTYYESGDIRPGKFLYRLYLERFKELVDMRKNCA
jgi:ribosome-binding protein aMBF1 (putative translation factor)